MVLVTMYIDVKLYGLEITAIFKWYEYVKDNTFWPGELESLLLLEKELLYKLKHVENDTVSFSEAEIEILCAWMGRAVYCKYGSEEALFGYERRAYMKLKSREGVFSY